MYHYTHDDGLEFVAVVDQATSVGGTLESIVDQATGGSNNKMNDDDEDVDTRLDDSSYTMFMIQPLATSVDDITTTTTTMGVNYGTVVPSSQNQLQLTSRNIGGGEHDQYMSSLHVSDDKWEIQHRTSRSTNREEYCYMSNEVADMNNSVVAFEPFTCREGWMTMVGDHQEDDSASHSQIQKATDHEKWTGKQRTTKGVPGRTQRQKPSSAWVKNKTSPITIQSIQAHPFHGTLGNYTPQQSWTSPITTSCNERSKATILHNKAERKRRYKISQRMAALQRLVPNICYKTDKATLLDQVIEYIKQLQTQQSNDEMMMIRNGMINNMSYPMMIQMPCYTFMQQQQQQQLQMSMMHAQMGMGLDLGSMQLTNSIMYPNLSTGTRTPVIVHPTYITPSSNDS